MEAYPGLWPWHMDRFTPAELDMLEERLKEREAEAKRARRDAERRSG